MGDRAVGGRIMISGDMFDWGADIDESMDPNKDPTNANRREGLFYSTRLQYTVWSGEGKKARYIEDYQGKPGQSLMLTADIGYDNNDYGLADTRIDAYCFGFEALLHYDGLSALMEWRSMDTKENSYIPGGVSNSIGSRVFCIQAGYCIPVSGIQIEPALRFQYINLNMSSDETASYNSGSNAATVGIPNWIGTYGGATDRVNSGRQVDAGINWIFTNYTMLQTSFSRWQGEASTGTAHHPDANIFRSQLQLAF